jgi:hypothetical protein
MEAMSQSPLVRFLAIGGIIRILIFDTSPIILACTFH